LLKKLKLSTKTTPIRTKVSKVSNKSTFVNSKTTQVEIKNDRVDSNTTPVSIQRSSKYPARKTSAEKEKSKQLHQRYVENLPINVRVLDQYIPQSDFYLKYKKISIPINNTFTNPVELDIPDNFYPR
jgi:hypothetical protein